MVALLATEKQRLLAERGEVTRRDFEEAWQACWAQMITERAWPHATPDRRGWRTAMLATKTEARAAFLGEPTAFATATERLTDAAAGMCVDLRPEQIPKALLVAIAFAGDE